MSFVTFLTGVENALWYVAIGLLISGGILVILSFIFNLETITHALGFGDHDISADHDVSLGDHDISVDHDVSVDHDISIDHDVSIDHDISVDHDVSVDHDISVDHDVSVDHTLDHGTELEKDVSVVHLDGLKDATHSSAPIFLLLSTYFLIFGILGVSTLNIVSSITGVRVFRILIVIIAPLLLAWAITKIWKRISSTTVQPIQRGVKLVGEIGTVFAAVDSKGGIIHVDLGEGQGIQKLHAKSFDHYKRFEREDKVRIVAVKNRVYLVDVI